MSVTTYKYASTCFLCRSQQNTNSKLLGMDHEISEEQRACSSGRTGRTRQKSSASSSTNAGLTKTLGGDPPPFNDWTSLARDPSGKSIYMYGGVRPNSQTSTSDFYRLDFETKSWTNLTVCPRIPFTSAAAPTQSKFLFFRTLCCTWMVCLILIRQKRRVSPSSIIHPVPFSPPMTAIL